MAGSWAGCISRSRLALNDELRRRLHQALPFLDVLAHEHLVGGGRRDDAVLLGLHAAADAEPSLHVDPLGLLARKPSLDLLVIGEVVDFAGTPALLLGTHAQRV